MIGDDNGNLTGCVNVGEYRTKASNNKLVVVELKASRNLHGSEKLGWSACGMKE